MINNLKTVREALGLTQAEVARAAGVSIRAYRYYEMCKCEPAVSVGLRIAQIVDVNPYSLWGLSDKPTR